MYAFESRATTVAIPAGRTSLTGHLHVPASPRGLILFAHNTGSSRHSPRNQRVAEFLQEVGLATLLFDLLSADEEPENVGYAPLRFDIGLLAQRLRLATLWAREQPEIGELLVGYFGASGGAAAALRAAVTDGAGIAAIVTRGGRVDLAADILPRVRTPTLLIAGANDEANAAANLEAWACLRCEKAIEIIPGTGARFEEPGALDNVSSLAARWFIDHFQKEGPF